MTLHTRGKYCSKKCADESRIKYKNCVVCDTKYRPKDSRSLTCSKECFIKFKNKDKVKLNCLTCNEIFYEPECRKDIGKFCSEKCYRISRRTGIKKTPNCKCDVCDSEFYKAKSVQLKHQFNYCSRDCMAKHYSESKRFSGENSPTWNGGKKTYYGDNWHSQRRVVRERDNYSCQKCGIKEDEYGMELSVHHIIPFTVFDDYLVANDSMNLTSLCEPCHRKIHSGKNHPTKFNETYNKIIS